MGWGEEKGKEKGRQVDWRLGGGAAWDGTFSEGKN